MRFFDNNNQYFNNRVSLSEGVRRMLSSLNSADYETLRELFNQMDSNFVRSNNNNYFRNNYNGNDYNNYRGKNNNNNTRYNNNRPYGNYKGRNFDPNYQRNKYTNNNRNGINYGNNFRKKSAYAHNDFPIEYNGNNYNQNYRNNNRRRFGHNEVFQNKSFNVRPRKQYPTNNNNNNQRNINRFEPLRNNQNFENRNRRNLSNQRNVINQRNHSNQRNNNFNQINRQNYTTNNRFKNIPVKKIENILATNENLTKVKGIKFTYATGNNLKFRRENINPKIPLNFNINDILLPRRFEDNVWINIKPLFDQWNEMFKLFLNFNRINFHGVLVNVTAKCNFQYLEKHLNDINQYTEARMVNKLTEEILELENKIRECTSPKENMAAMKLAAMRFKKQRRFKIWETNSVLGTLMNDIYDLGKIFYEDINNDVDMEMNTVENHTLDNNINHTQINNTQNISITSNNFIQNNLTQEIITPPNQNLILDYQNQFPPLLRCSCPLCPNSFPSVLNVMSHLKNCIKRNLTQNNNKCNTCIHTFENENDVVTHMANHWDFQLNGQLALM